MGAYSALFDGFLNEFKQQITIIPRERGNPDLKGRAVWVEGEPFQELAIVQPISEPIEAGERTQSISEGLNIYIKRDANIRAQDLIEIAGRRYGILTLHKTDLQIEIAVKEAKT